MLETVKSYFSNLVSYFIDSLWEEDLMPLNFRQKKSFIKKNKNEETKCIQSQSVEAQVKMPSNVVYFPRKTNMGKCKRGHSVS